MQSRDDYIEAAKSKLDEWNEQISKTEAKMKAASQSAREEYERQLIEMRAHADQAQKQMRELTDSSYAEWEKHRTNFEAAWGDIAAGFGRAWSRFHP
ncbi:hypothetical protein [Acuticoccus sp. I52.16.1]|uniref:hypothetical protein n=1 Tax=Acuticoccus sp. I52.16.1 TaxID=2928472 RepID=UPI001FCFAA29|nr:hypothetical protein [Acuticoccus sp. I52.16.1]UOM33956.1 hypothetical protein MRB58_19285 [Acuticoccus sp. I52.16.1]